MPALSSPLCACDVCGARVHELRRGRCWGCYSRWVDARPVGLGARCVVCAERRRRLLRSVELHGGWYPMCFACAGQVAALDPVPPTIAELKTALTRERRANDRRIGKPDIRVFRYERRVGERRFGRDECPIDDDMIVEITIEEDELPPVAPVAVVAGPAADELDFDDQTRIRELLA